MNLKVFLGNSPWNKPGFYGVRAGSRWPHFESEFDRYMPFPFQLAYAAALLEENGIETLLVDGIAEKLTPEAFVGKALEFEPDLVLLEVSSPSFDTDLRYAHRLRSQLPPSCRLAFCGPHVPMSRPGFLENHPDVDLVLTGEYELTVTRVAQALGRGGSLAGVAGLVFRNRDGIVRQTGKPEIITNLDSLPWPARHFLPMTSYFDNPGDIPEPAVQMWGSRGCPFSCSYCIWPQLMEGNSYRPRKVDRILDEIEHVVAEYGFRSIYFDDDTFNIGKKRMLEFCRQKIRRGIDLPWAIMARADLMDPEVLDAMAAAGLTGVKYGIESAVPRLLKNISKDLRLDRAIENVRYTKKLGIKVHLTFMFGIPGETQETVRRTVRLARDLDPDSIQFSILTPLPGTRIYDELEARGHLQAADWQQFDGYFSSVIRTDAMTTRDLERAVRWAWRSWLTHKLLKQLTADGIKTLIRSVPGYLRNPIALQHQLKRVLHV